MFTKHTPHTMRRLIQNLSETDMRSWWLPWGPSNIETAEQGCLGLKRKTTGNSKTNETERYLFSAELLAGSTNPSRPTTAFVAWIAPKLHEANLVWVAPRILADFSKGKALAEGKNAPWMADLDGFIRDKNVFRSPMVTSETFTLMGWLTAQLEISQRQKSVEGASNGARCKNFAKHNRLRTMPDALDIVSIALALQYDLTLVTAKNQIKHVKSVISQLKLITISDLPV